MILINKYISPFLSSNMYVLEDSNSVIVVDPFDHIPLIEKLIGDNNKVDYVFLTHEHYDHISGVNLFKKKFSPIVICNFYCQHSINSPSLNLSKYYNCLIDCMSDSFSSQIYQGVDEYFCEADISFEKKLKIKWLKNDIHLFTTPGHSNASMCVKFGDDFLFSGDTLIKGIDTITKLRSGSKKKFIEFTIPFLNGLKKDIMVYPGHGVSFFLKEHHYINQVNE